jgi:hypothetical protein
LSESSDGYCLRDCLHGTIVVAPSRHHGGAITPGHHDGAITPSALSRHQKSLYQLSANRVIARIGRCDRSGFRGLIGGGGGGGGGR